MRAQVVVRGLTVEEFSAISAAVGFKPDLPESIRIGLSNTWYAVCAVAKGSVVGLGRIVSDGALEFYIAGVIVSPLHQRQGIGSAIVEAVLAKLGQVTYANVLVEVLPLPAA